MINENDENINPQKYAEMEDSSKTVPTDKLSIKKILNNVSNGSLTGSRGIFSRGTHGSFTEDSTLLDEIEAWYSKALDSVGLNFSDPIQAYGTHFNKNMQTLGLDPQRPGNSYVFFTRPDLNLRLGEAGMGMTPFFDYILKSEIGNFVAEYLQYPNSADSVVKLDKKYKTVSPFDPLKSNLCKEVSGVKDIVLDSYETVGDFMGHQLSYATGTDGYDSTGEVTVTFDDTTLSPLFLSHYLHLQYINEVSRGDYWPKYEYLVRRIIDYTISIYIFKLAEDNRTILRWGKLTGCYPINISLNSLNYSKEIKLDDFDELNVTYKYNFWEPMEPRIFQDFNMLSFPAATVGTGDDIFDKNYKNPNYLGSLKFKDQTSPDKLIEMYDTDTVSRADALWGSHPLVIGNKLVFV